MIKFGFLKFLMFSIKYHFKFDLGQENGYLC